MSVQRPASSPITRRDIDRLAFPAIIAGIAEPVISLVDTAFVGRLGTADLAAVGIASSFFLLVVWVLAQTRSAVMAIVARYYGAQRLDEVKDLVPIAIWMNVLLGLLFFSITSWFAGPIFRMYNAEGEVLAKAIEYYHIRSIGHPIVLATFAITGAFRGIQNLRWSMWISIAGALVNLVLNPILIFGCGPIEGMGIAGSAWSSLIAQIIMVLIAIWILEKKTPFRLFTRKWHHPDLKELWILSRDLFGRTIALNICYYLGNRYATSYGVAHIGAHSIAMQIWLFSAFFIDGYSSAGSVLTGRFNGERNWKELYRVAWQVVRMSVTIGSVLAVIYLAGYNLIGGIFTSDPQVLLLLGSIFWIVIITQPINAIAFTFDGVYKGLGNGKILRNSLIVATFLVFIPIAWLTDQLGWQLYAVWAAFLSWMIARGLLLALHFQKNYHPRQRLRASIP